jgi:uncharacterized protein
LSFRAERRAALLVKEIPMHPAKLSALASPGPCLPWWRVGMVWFALSGPAIVVIAGLVTAAIAVHGADPVLRVDATRAAPQAPAIQARNHAATGGPRP